MLNIAKACILLVGLLGVVFAGVPKDAKADGNDNSGLTSSEITYLTALLCVVFALVVVIMLFAAVTYRLRLYWKRATERNQLLAEPAKIDNVDITGA